MDETEFRDAEGRLNARPCAFAKAIQIRCCDCSRARTVLLAEREAVTCLSPAAHARCMEAVALLRAKAVFTLHLTHPEPALPHGKETRVECGGLLGLRAALGEGQGAVADIHALMEAALDRYGTLADLPYSEIVKSIAGYEARRRRS